MRVAARIARIAAYAVLVAAALYLVAINVVLRTSLLRDGLGADPESMVVAYDAAYSIVPGLVHAQGLRIRGRDSNVEWILSIDRVDFHVSFADLLRHRFHATHVHGDGVSLRLRARRDVVTPDELAAIPPIPGFDYPPLRNVGPPTPELTDANYNLWTIWLEDVEAHTREIWIDEQRWAGDMRIHGRWYFKPLRWVDIGPATIELGGVQASLGMVQPLARDLQGPLVVVVYPIDIVNTHGLDALHQISVFGALAGRLHVAGVLRLALGPSGVDVADADSDLALRVAIDHGVVRPGTRVALDPFRVEARLGRAEVDGVVSPTLEVEDAAVVHAEIHGTDLRYPERGTVRDRAEHLSARAATHETGLTRLIEGPRSFVDARVEARGVRVGIGDATVTANALEAEAKGVDAGSDRLSLKAAAASLRDVHVRRGTAEVNVGALEARAGRLEQAQGNLELAEVATHVEAIAMHDPGRSATAHDLQATTADVRMRGAEIALGETAARLQGIAATFGGVPMSAPSIALHARRIDHARAGFRGLVAVDAPDVELPSLTAVAWHVPLPEGIRIQGGRAIARARLEVDVGALAASGVADVSVRNVRVQVGSQTMTGHVKVTVRAAQRGEVTDLAGTAVAFEDAGGPETIGWWGRVEATYARVRLRGGARLQARIAIRAKDAAPAVAMLANATAIPSWALDAISTKRLSATGEIVVAPRVLEARSVRALGDGVGLGFEFAKLGPEKQWALIVESGTLRAAVDAERGKTSVMLFGAEPWFLARSASLRAVERRYE